MSSEIEISHVYFINLPTRLDRLEHMYEQLKYCSWSWSRVEAIRLEKPAEELGFELIPRLKGKTHVVSIWLSHRKALQTVLDTGGTSSFLILEDDVQIQPEIWGQTLSLRCDLPTDWEILLISPRFRIRNLDTEGKPIGWGWKWLKAPFGQKAVLLCEIPKEFVCTGAHFVIFRDLNTIRKVVNEMDACHQLFDVDLFYLLRFKTYGIEDERVGTRPLGSDHH